MRAPARSHVVGVGSEAPIATLAPPRKSRRAIPSSFIRWAPVGDRRATLVRKRGGSQGAVDCSGRWSRRRNGQYRGRVGWQQGGEDEEHGQEEAERRAHERSSHAHAETEQEGRSQRVAREDEGRRAEEEGSDEGGRAREEDPGQRLR